MCRQQRRSDPTGLGTHPAVQLAPPTPRPGAVRFISELLH
jgi:hypothetical protein